MSAYVFRRPSDSATRSARSAYVLRRASDDAQQQISERHPGFYTEQRDLLLSFVISFLVIFAFWTAHGSIYRQLRAAGVDDAPWLGLMNMLWLLTIAFLPFPTALVGRDLGTASAVLYVGTMLVLSALTSGLSVVASRAAGDARPNLAWLTTAVFAVCTVAAFVNADLALYLLLLLVPARIIEGRLRQQRATADQPG